MIMPAKAGIQYSPTFMVDCDCDSVLDRPVKPDDDAVLPDRAAPFISHQRLAAGEGGGGRETVRSQPRSLEYWIVRSSRTMTNSRCGAGSRRDDQFLADRANART
jgi:hypothetical protein